jgi:hypothetical protein
MGGAQGEIRYARTRVSQGVELAGCGGWPGLDFAEGQQQIGRPTFRGFSKAGHPGRRPLTLLFISHRDRKRRARSRDPPGAAS